MIVRNRERKCEARVRVRLAYNYPMLKIRNQSGVATEKARGFRRTMGESERKLWALLRNRRQEFKFRRQHPVGPYFLDFYCAEARLCVELDGALHAQRKEGDCRRDTDLASLEVETHRVSTSDLYEDSDAVVERIWRQCRERLGASK